MKFIRVAFYFIVFSCLPSCVASGSFGNWCDLVPDSVCIPRGRFVLEKRQEPFTLATAKVIFSGENFVLKDGRYGATLTLSSLDEKAPLSTKAIQYEIKDGVARLSDPASIEDWIYRFVKTQTIVLSFISDKVRIVITDPYSSSGKLVSILMYEDLPLSSSTVLIRPTKGCWYNETLCSAGKFDYKRIDGK